MPPEDRASWRSSSRPSSTSSTRSSRRKNDHALRSAPDVTTVAAACRLLRQHPPEQLGLSKTCTLVDWSADATTCSSTADAEPVAPPRPGAPGGGGSVRVSAKRGALTSLGALARGAHLNGWRLVVAGNDAPAEIFWVCKAGELGALVKDLRAKHDLARERGRAVAYRTTAWVNGERVVRVVTTPPRKLTRLEADVSADPAAPGAAASDESGAERSASASSEEDEMTLERAREGEMTLEKALEKTRLDADADAGTADARGEKVGGEVVSSVLSDVTSRAAPPNPYATAGQRLAARSPGKKPPSGPFGTLLSGTRPGASDSPHSLLPRRLRARVGKLPGAHDLCQKVRFARLMNQARALFPDEYRFWPPTLALPDDWLDAAPAFARSEAEAGHSWFIVKPDRGSQGAGIFLADSPRDLESKIRRIEPRALYDKNLGGGLFGDRSVAGPGSLKGAPGMADASRPGGGFGFKGASGRGGPTGAWGRAFDRRSRETIFGGREGSSRDASDRSDRSDRAPVSGLPVGESEERPGAAFVCQRYLVDPMLLDGLKFDLRVYVLVLGLPGFPAFVAKDGLARLCTEKYERPGGKGGGGGSASSGSNPRGFLTNYAVNKKAEGFERSDFADEGSKRSLESVMRRMGEGAWGKIEALVEATVGAVSHAFDDAARAMRVDPGMCFHLFGFDVMFDADENPHLLEVNAGPSLGVDVVVPLDEDDAFATTGPGLGDGGARGSPRSSSFRHSAAARRGYARSRGAPSAALSRCASLALDDDESAAPCFCRDHRGAHRHELSPVDAEVKAAVVAGALEIVRRAQVGADLDAPTRYGGFRRAGAGGGGGGGDRAGDDRRGGFRGGDAAGGGGGGDALAELHARARRVFDLVADAAGECAHSKARRLVSRCRVRGASEPAKPSVVPSRSAETPTPRSDGDATAATAATAAANGDDASFTPAAATSDRFAPPRRRVPVVTLANSELDLVLRPWRARRRKCATALSHFVDLVATLAAKFYPDRNGSDAVDAMLETMELAAAGASLA